MPETLSQNGHPQPAADRSADGKFPPGYAGDPGNPFARRVAALREVFIDAVSEHDLQEIAGVLAQRAKRGHVAAGRLLLAYVLGKPAPVVNPDDLDLDELARRFRCPAGGAAMRGIMDRYRPEVLLAWDRSMAYCQREEFLATFGPNAKPVANGKKDKRRRKTAGRAVWPWQCFSTPPIGLVDKELLRTTPSANGSIGGLAAPNRNGSGKGR
jgi:hypothetical protein